KEENGTAAVRCGGAGKWALGTSAPDSAHGGIDTDVQCNASLVRAEGSRLIVELLCAAKGRRCKNPCNRNGSGARALVAHIDGGGFGHHRRRSGLGQLPLAQPDIEPARDDDGRAEE